MEPEGYYRVHSCWPPVLNLSHNNSVHVSPSQFLKLHFNIILHYKGTKSDTNICGTVMVLSNRVERMIVITILSGLHTLRAHSWCARSVDAVT